MATPRFDALVAKVRDWSNKPEVNTIPDSVIQSCLSYAADEAYRLLRIPPLEETGKVVVDGLKSVDNPVKLPAKYIFPKPSLLRPLPASIPKLPILKPHTYSPSVLNFGIDAGSVIS